MSAGKIVVMSHARYMQYLLPSSAARDNLASSKGPNS